MALATVLNEHRHEGESDVLAAVYLEEIHTVTVDALREGGHEVRTATLSVGNAESRETIDTSDDRTVH